MINNWIKSEVLAQPPYQVRSETCSVKLNQNESPWDLPLDVKKKILSRLEKLSWNRYPKLMPDKLKRKLAQKLYVSYDQIVIGKGSNEVLQAICHVVLKPGDKVCILAPTFAVYRLLAEQSQAKVIESPLNEKFQVNEEDLLSKVQRAKLTLLSNPNSPTGTLVSVETLRKLVENTKGLVVCDEAYVDFSGVTVLPLLGEYDNLVITRTFSKAFALAGFRIGYAVMNEGLAHQVQKGLLPFNMDIPSVVALEVVLANDLWVKEKSSEIVREREQLIQRLNGIEAVKAWPSSANFFLLETVLGAEKTFQGLINQGILVRDVSNYPGCEKVVRVTVGTPQENEVLYQGVKKILSQELVEP